MMNKSYQKIITFFKEKLVQLPSELLEGFSIPSETRDLLENIGLPENLDVLLLNFYSNNIEELMFNNNKYIVIGDDYGTKICIEQKSGEVYSICTENKYTVRFINSSIQCFLQFLITYIETKPALIGVDDDEAVVIIDKLRKVFLSVDEKSLGNDENWWSVVLEQHAEGLI